MEHIYTTIKNLLNYVQYIEYQILENFPISIEREDLLKCTLLSTKIIELLIKINAEKKFKVKTDIEMILNEIYAVLKKIKISLNDFDVRSIFNKERNMKLLKEACNRNELYLRLILSDLENNKNFAFTSSKNLKTTETTSFKLILSNFKNFPNTPEYFFSNLSKLKDEIYYLKTNDYISYFYFSLAKVRNEIQWYWSPPKKSDQEDVWIKAPETKINTGCWEGKPLSIYIKDFIIWLDIFRPNIPEFYLLKRDISEDGAVTNRVTTHKELTQKMEILEHRMLNEDKCIIF